MIHGSTLCGADKSSRCLGLKIDRVLGEVAMTMMDDHTLFGMDDGSMWLGLKIDKMPSWADGLRGLYRWVGR